jgi:Sec-independent protein secretion pathway component TatC
LWFASIVVGAMLSPPDPLSLALIAAPMIVLFEIALLIDRIIPQQK